MYVWMDACMHGCMYGWMYGCMYVCMYTLFTVGQKLSSLYIYK